MPDATEAHVGGKAVRRCLLLDLGCCLMVVVVVVGVVMLRLW
jgi:hypothetical protein